MIKHIVIKSVFMLQVKIIPTVKPIIFSRAYTRCVWPWMLKTTTVQDEKAFLKDSNFICMQKDG